MGLASVMSAVPSLSNDVLSGLGAIVLWAVNLTSQIMELRERGDDLGSDDEDGYEAEEDVFIFIFLKNIYIYIFFFFFNNFI